MIVCTILYDLGRQVSQQLMTILKKLALFYRRSVQVGGNDISTEDQGWGQYPLYGKRTMKCTPTIPIVRFLYCHTIDIDGQILGRIWHTSKPVYLLC